MPANRLAQLAASHQLSGGAVEQLSTLLELLATDDTAPTTVREPERAVDVHVADCLSALTVPPVRCARVIADLGAGAGLPALVLAAALPEARVVALESVRRKCAYVERAVTAMGLSNVEVACERAEAWRDGFEQCDVVCVRAVAPLAVLCEYAAPLLRLGGWLVAWKGRLDDGEHADACFAAAHLGLTEPVGTAVQPYPGSHSRRLYCAQKVQPTPASFPRRPGMAVKRPLAATPPATPPADQ